MTDQMLDDLMRSLLLDTIKLDVGREEPPELTFAASSGHRSQIRAMLKNPLHWARKQGRPLWKQILRTAAAAVLAVAIGFGGVMAASPAARAAVIRWVVEWYETHIVYRYFGEMLDEEMPHYEITGLADGYVETDRVETDVSGSVFYENSLGGIVCFDYVYLQQGSVTIFVSGDSDVIDFPVNGMEGQLHIPHDPEGMLTITWIDERENVQFRILSNLDKETIIYMAESVCVKK